MNLNAVNAASNTNSTTAAPNSAQDANGMFMQLLMAQLKSQSPLDPVDPNQFVGQLVQFNTLDQLIQIREMVQQALGGTTPTTSTQGAQ
jgi:flagellar basal-body rod modification protein FlgD